MDNFAQTEISLFLNQTVILNYTAYGEMNCLCNLKLYVSLRHAVTLIGSYPYIIM
jgi:hypothetical protein